METNRTLTQIAVHNKTRKVHNRDGQKILLMVPGSGHEPGLTQEEILDYESDEAWDCFYEALTPVAIQMSKAEPSGVTPGRPPHLALFQNTPNPFNPRTVLSFRTTSAGPAKLRVFDVSGRLIAVLVDEQLEPGIHEIEWGARDLRGEQVSAGTHFYRLDAEGQSTTRKMALLR